MMPITRVGVLLALLLCAPSSSASAQRGGGRGRAYVEPGPNPSYDGRYTFARIKYEMGGGGGGGGLGGFGFGRGGGEPPWHHDYPDGERNFTQILGELTTIRVRPTESVVLGLDDPELFKYPVAYMAEPGYWQPTDGEVAGLRTYLLKGGFIIFDDFRGRDWLNLQLQFQRVLPELRWLQVDGTHPIFDAFYRIPNPEEIGSYGQYAPTYWALFEDNDPRRRMLALANRDGDISEFWEYSGSGFYPVDITNEAYKIGINYLVYALSR